MRFAQLSVGAAFFDTFVSDDTKGTGGNVVGGNSGGGGGGGCAMRRETTPLLGDIAPNRLTDCARSNNDQ